MNIKAVLFDLDGTLLPMDNDEFTKAYLRSLAEYMVKFEYEPQKFIKTIWNCVNAMVLNDGKQTNEKVFWNTFCTVYGKKALRDIQHFEDYYKTDFQTVRAVSKPDVSAKTIVEKLKEKGIRIIIATNPFFPKIATESRIDWAGLQLSDFELVTTYENSSYCKPNPLYYKEILKKQKLLPEECLMVGNDFGEDMIARTIGMKVFLLTDYLINKDNADINSFPHGDFGNLLEFIEKM